MFAQARRNVQFLVKNIAKGELTDGSRSNYEEILSAAISDVGV